MTLVFIAHLELETLGVLFCPWFLKKVFQAEPCICSPIPKLSQIWTQSLCSYNQSQKPRKSYLFTSLSSPFISHNTWASSFRCLIVLWFQSSMSKPCFHLLGCSYARPGAFILYNVSYASAASIKSSGAFVIMFPRMKKPRLEKVD